MTFEPPLNTSDSFYRAFEERNRGSRQLIKSRLQAYLPFVEPIKLHESELNAIDLGCGRGEWLEVLRDAGFLASGVDLDEGMLAACHALSLDAQQVDALDFLQTIPTESISVISAFHVVEHISFDHVRLLIRQALRALKPGGLLILETPNPENIVVGSSLFYLDPTHQRPIPSELLSFAVEFEGFARNTVVRLQEPASIKTESKLHLMQVLNAVSPDYAVVAQKKATPQVMSLFDEAFGKSYGVKLTALADRYQSECDARHELLINQSSSWMTYCENRLTQGDERYAHFNKRAMQLEWRLERIEFLLMRAGAIRAILRRMSANLRKAPKWSARKFVGLIRRSPRLYQLCVRFSRALGIHAILIRLSSANVARSSNSNADAMSERTEHLYEQLKKAQKGQQEKM